jgi:hypothetical protein
VSDVYTFKLCSIILKKGSHEKQEKGAYQVRRNVGMK